MGVTNQSGGSWTIFLRKRFLLLKDLSRIAAGHVNESTLY